MQDDKISCDLGGEYKGWDNCYYKQLKRLEQDKKHHAETRRKTKELKSGQLKFIKEQTNEKC